MERRITITLNDLQFYSKIGVDPQERIVGNEFRVNIAAAYNAASFRSEQLQTTISYADIYEIISQEMKMEWELMESVAQSVTDKIISRWNQIEEIIIEIIKVTPPIPGIVGNCGIKYFWKKS